MFHRTRLLPQRPPRVHFRHVRSSLRIGGEGGEGGGWGGGGRDGKGGGGGGRPIGVRWSPAECTVSEWVGHNSRESHKGDCGFLVSSIHALVTLHTQLAEHRA